MTEKLNIQRFQRRPFPVDGVRVTKKNMDLVAQWCNGEVRSNAKGVKHIFIDVHRPMTERQTMAFPGDWILFADRGYKIYTQNAFSRNFELVQAGTGSDHADFEPIEKDEAIPGLEDVEIVKPAEQPKHARKNVSPEQMVRRLQKKHRPNDDWVAGDPHRN